MTNRKLMIDETRFFKENFIEKMKRIFSNVFFNVLIRNTFLIVFSVKSE